MDTSVWFVSNKWRNSHDCYAVSVGKDIHTYVCRSRVDEDFSSVLFVY